MSILVACFTASVCLCLLTRGERVSPTNVRCLTLVTLMIECLNDDRCWINGPTDTLQTGMLREREEERVSWLEEWKSRNLRCLTQATGSLYSFDYLHFPSSPGKRWRREGRRRTRVVTWARQTNNLVYWRIQIESVFNRRRCCLAFRLNDNMSIEFDAPRLTGSESYKGRSSSSSRQLNQHCHLCNLLHPSMFTFLASAKASSPPSSFSSFWRHAHRFFISLSGHRLQSAHSLLDFPSSSSFYTIRVGGQCVTSH